MFTKNKSAVDFPNILKNVEKFYRTFQFNLFINLATLGIFRFPPSHH
ncbi:hypothetical protein NT05HA_0938 [Aggregatibacter aphrophilus NJ8700]|nr:hypothetical protein NT05HA_0938 [Aggregatibacter aphrophilus NJ8700]